MADLEQFFTLECLFESNFSITFSPVELLPVFAAVNNCASFYCVRTMSASNIIRLAFQCALYELVAQYRLTGEGKKTLSTSINTMLSTSKNVPFAGHIHLLTTDADDPSHGNRTFLEVDGMVVSWWIVAFWDGERKWCLFSY